MGAQELESHQGSTGLLTRGTGDDIVGWVQMSCRTSGIMFQWTEILINQRPVSTEGRCCNQNKVEEAEGNEGPNYHNCERMR